MDTTPRIAPLEAPFAPETAAELDRWMPPGAGLPPLALFRTLATDLPLAQAMHPLGSFLLSRRFALSLREREIVIDRVCARCGCGYEWGVHVAAFGDAAALVRRASQNGPPVEVPTVYRSHSPSATPVTT